MFDSVLGSYELCFQQVLKVKVKFKTKSHFTGIAGVKIS